jgi:3-methyladenine DNA glycosylase AlkD
MNTQEAVELGKRLAPLVQAGQTDRAYTMLWPTLAERTPFRLLDRIGAMVGMGPLPPVNSFLERIAAAKTMGGWVVIASALSRQFERDPAGVFARCRSYVSMADVWYATDILGERVPGPALVTDFEPTLTLLAPWREDPDRWLRRTTGVAVHLWAKRSGGALGYVAQTKALLAFLEPMFEEPDLEAVKGVGWGLKTLGKHYPDLVTEWLVQQVKQHRGRYRALMLRKALTHLSDDQRACVMGGKS